MDQLFGLQHRSRTDPVITGVCLLYHRGGLRQPLTSSKVLLGPFIMQLYKKALRRFV